MTTSLPPIAYPGLPLGPSTTYSSGPGTHLQTINGVSQIIASLAGRPILTPTTSTSTSTSTPQKATTGPKTLSTNPKAPLTLPTISIPRILESPNSTRVVSKNVSAKNTLLGVGSVVLGVVRRVRGRQVEVGICVVWVGGGEAGVGGGGGSGIVGENMDMDMGKGEWTVCADEWPAVLRKEDVRATEKEKVVCGEGFRVGDVVRGVVISLGDQSNYYLTTAKNELGVIMARSEAGNDMYPISWKEFRDPETGTTESRKVAKPY